MADTGPTRVPTRKEQILDKLKDLHFDTTNISELVIRVMVAVEAYPELSGEEKRALTLDICGELIDRVNSLNDTTKFDIKMAIPNILEGVIAISKGEFFTSKKDRAVEMIRVHQDIDTIYRRARDILGRKGQLDAEYITSNTLLVVATVMNLMKEYQYMDGLDKKNIVIVLVRRIVNDIPDKTPDQDAALELALLALPGMIDMVYGVAKNKFKLNSNGGRAWWKCC